jgi:hypothetical protein
MNNIETANRVLNSFANGARIEKRSGGWYVCWSTSRGSDSRRWQTRSGQDFYPTWSHKWIGGGTSCTALAQLIRWLRGQPVLPISTWQYWSTETVKLVSPEAVEMLRAGGYPVHANCVLCGQQVTSLDWWNLNGVSGPCCGWTSGCRQNQEVKSCT